TGCCLQSNGNNSSCLGPNCTMPFSDAHLGSKPHAIKEYGRRKHHGNDWTNKGDLQRMSVGDPSHQSWRRHVPQEMNDENVERDSCGADVSANRIDQGRIEQSGVEQEKKCREENCGNPWQ